MQKLLWDDTYLYFLAMVSDESAHNDSPNSYDDDQVELYIDADNAKATTYDANDCQYSFGWNDGTLVGTIPANASKADISYAAVETENGYIVEARMPWTTLQASATAGKVLGIDFMINDDDNGAARDAKLSWNAATDDAFQNASLFGNGKLLAEELVITGTERDAMEQFSVYPNPATNELYIQGFTKDFEYSLFDVAGRTMLEGKDNQKVNISKLEPGMYALKVTQHGQFKVIPIYKW